jgi:DEAD/DEAH box helicase domain-containing protein
MNYIVFDIETYSPSDKDKIDVNELKASVIGAYYSWNNKYICFTEDYVTDFIESLKFADLIVGYNHLWFDLPVLAKYSNFDLKALPNYDIMLEIEQKLGFKPKLNDICLATLNSSKTDDYSSFKHYYSQKNWLPLIDYCMHDVKLTHQLFQLILEQKPLKYNDLLDTKEIVLDEVDVGNYKSQITFDNQNSLF